MGEQLARLSHTMLANLLGGAHVNIVPERAEAVARARAARRSNIGDLDALLVPAPKERDVVGVSHRD